MASIQNARMHFYLLIKTKNGANAKMLASHLTTTQLRKKAKENQLASYIVKKYLLLLYQNRKKLKFFFYSIIEPRIGIR